MIHNVGPTFFLAEDTRIMRITHCASRVARLVFAMLAASAVCRPASAQISLEGEWTGRYQEDFMDRVQCVILMILRPPRGKTSGRHYGSSLWRLRTS
jgi:hypothetical protein